MPPPFLASKVGSVGISATDPTIPAGIVGTVGLTVKVFKQFNQFHAVHVANSYYHLVIPTGSYPNIHEILGAGITIAQTLSELQGYSACARSGNFSGADHFTLPHAYFKLLPKIDLTHRSLAFYSITRPVLGTLHRILCSLFNFFVF